MKKNKEGIANKTFKQRVFASNIVMVCIIVGCIALFNLINTISVDKYNESVRSLQSLNSFYENMGVATEYIKDYLYTENKKALTNYETHLEAAKEDASVLKEASSQEDYYRFVMLDRMRVSYLEISQSLIVNFEDNKGDYNDAYNMFLEAGTLIEQTSVDYYDINTKVLHSKLSNLKRVRNTTVLASVLLLGMLLVWLMHYSHQLSRSITTPIHLLLQNMKKVKKGEYDLSQVSGASKEMEDLCNEMNDMAHAVQTNIETTKEKAKLETQVLQWKNENLIKDELLVQSELKMLQNQINPHFLFNTLNMIYKLAIQEGADNAADILIKTSELLRYGLDKQSKLSDIKSEVDMLKRYIDIQEIRLGERVCFHLLLEDEEEVGRVQIPGMILQPLVENALKHGLNSVACGGDIEIHIQRKDNSAYIAVSDNGAGMDSGELERFILQDYHKDEGQHLGLYNVVKRLQMHYQERVEITINSDLECGFEIIIQIALRE